MGNFVSVPGVDVDNCLHMIGDEYASDSVTRSTAPTLDLLLQLIKPIMYCEKKIKKKKNNQKYGLTNLVQSRGLSRRLWLSAILSQAKAITGPSLMAWPGPAETGSAWPGSRL